MQSRRFGTLFKAKAAKVIHFVCHRSLQLSNEIHSSVLIELRYSSELHAHIVSE